MKVEPTDDQIKELKYKTERHDYANVMKSLESDNDYYKRNESVNKKKYYISILETLAGASGMAVGTTLTATGVRTQVGVPIARVSSFIISVAVF